jgi:hypothetical protein
MASKVPLLQARGRKFKMGGEAAHVVNPPFSLATLVQVRRDVYVIL